MEYHVTLTDPAQPLLDRLVAESGLSRQQIKQAMQKGAFWRSRGKHTQRIRRIPKKTQAGETFHLYYDEKVLAEQPPEPLLIADEGAYSVWYKPCGLRSQGAKWGDHCTVYRWAELHLQPQRPAFLVHRLDRAATGLILVAHEKKVAAALCRLFEQREIDKRYRVIVEGRFSDEVGEQAPERILDAELDGKRAVSRIRCLTFDEASNRSLLEVSIETGRKHQIRRHLAGAGFPVVGDRLYGKASDGDLQLTACSLAFTCPVTGRERTYPLPTPLLPAF